MNAFAHLFNLKSYNILIAFRQDIKDFRIKAVLKNFPVIVGLNPTISFTRQTYSRVKHGNDTNGARK